MSKSLADRAENMFYLYFGTLRVRAMSTETLASLLSGWEGECMIREIPVVVIQQELTHRGVCVMPEWQIN